MIQDKYAQTKELMDAMAHVKMLMNSHKHQIEENDTEFLLDKLAEEVAELKEAVHTGNYMHIIEEAADIHNYLVGLVHKEIGRYQIRK